MRMFYRVALKVCPPLALLFSVVVTASTMYIEEGISPLLLFVCVQVYLNWYCIYSISKNATTMKSTGKRSKSVAISITVEHNTKEEIRQSAEGRYKFWYCDKCCCYTYKPTQHCIPCKKCFHYRDHHCFFVGSCVLRQNMGNFILVCFHTSLACLYSLSVIGPRLNENISRRIAQSPSSQTFPRFLHSCFPVALARLLILGEDTDILLVILFDALFSVFFMCSFYGAWKFYICIIGKQRYYPHVPTRQNVKEIFGSYGLWNVVFPYNGLLGSRDIDGKFELKEV
ncbi:palmitoyltransferase ZDHHC22-like [Venturia canescens]|uniref:palmitoyltransferase ZDHHC22-like n=1 Tax=Venturia canescens TaxID=32260 RepID=UPI001C9C341E|nr:palmitoyltransferase ZDHHC22-like [Venturia canescens]